MNHDDRRELKLRAVKAIKGSLGFVLVSFDGKGMPVFHYDISKCQNEKDIRHLVMHKISLDVDTVLQSAGKNVFEKINQLKAEEYKEKRSEVLDAFRSDEGEPGTTKDNTDSGLDIQECDVLVGNGDAKAVCA